MYSIVVTNCNDRGIESEIKVKVEIKVEIKAKDIPKECILTTFMTKRIGTFNIAENTSLIRLEYE